MNAIPFPASEKLDILMGSLHGDPPVSVVLVDYHSTGWITVLLFCIPH